jgi:uncharacterized protein
MGKFVVKKTTQGFMFHLKANNGETIASSEVYETEESCLKGVASVQKNAPIANFEDMTEEPVKKATNPKFEMYKDKAGEFRFRLKARNGEIIATSEGYKARGGCLNGIESVKTNAKDSKIEKLA